MKISKTINEPKQVEMEIETPCWFKRNNFIGVSFYQVNSERDIMEVKLCDSYTTINRMPMNYYCEPTKIFESEKITEDEFKDAVITCINKLIHKTGVISIVLPAEKEVA